MSSKRHDDDRDRGAILVIVLVLSTVIATVVVSVAGYVVANLRYGNVVEDRADRLAAADGGLRFGIEKLRNFQTLCTTAAGSGTGFTQVFPPEINGATSVVTCRRVGTLISDLQGWGIVVTGEGVPSGTPIFTTKGAGGSNNVKTFSGPVYISDPTRISLAAKLEIENGDLWYTATDCDTPVTIPGMSNGYLVFTPDFFRGPQCTELDWDGEIFSRPSAATPPSSLPSWTVNPAPDTSDPHCRVFSPGTYTTAPSLGSANYFKAGDYYFENVTIELKNKVLIAGYADGGGDTAKIDSSDCETAIAADKFANNAIGARGGATFWFGGTSKINVENGGELEIFRRLQTESYVSIYALDAGGPGYTASTLGYNSWILETKSGSNNDVAIHGLVWAPRAGVTLGNITNAANGQLLGGIVIALLDTQASASASAFSIGIEVSPADSRLLLISTATKGGRSTSIRAVVQFRPDSGELAINSWRVAS